MKKKLLLIIAFIFFLSGCNVQIIDTTWKYDKAYINVGSETIICEVSSWKDFENSDMLQVRCKDGRTFLGHSAAIILVDE
jgi:uncharacterized lipoprotein NlpE involved in copper resistance